MPYDVKRFIFSVSLCAMLAVNPVLATAPGETESVGTAHTVYDGTKLNKATNGIAGVGYVNRMVDAAGNAATAAEAHAAAAGAHALSAAQSADEAHKVLADKVNIAQGADKKNLAMVTDGEGSVYPGYITNDMIDDNAVTTNKIADKSVGLEKLRYDNAYASGIVSGGIPLVGDGATGLALSQISSVGIADGAVTIDKIGHSSSVEDHYTVLVNSSGGVYWKKITDSNIRDGAVTSGKIANYAVTANKIADGAVTIDKTDGVVGMVPVGSADATTYGQFWIE